MKYLNSNYDNASDMLKADSTITFDDVLLVPQYSDIESRSEINLHAKLDSNITLNNPIISAPMDTVTESGMANALGSLGSLSIIHRYLTIEKQVEEFNNVKNKKLVGCAIGVKGDYLERTKALYDSKCRIFCIDVAHAHHKMVLAAVKELRRLYGCHIHIMVGNVATREAIEFFSDMQIKYNIIPPDSIKIGIGSGSICTTKINTGHGIPQLQSIIECSRAKAEFGLSSKLIADGGIKNAGDICKALACGADFVMLGSLLAGTEETPGQFMHDENNQLIKSYRGMASKESQSSFVKKESYSVEGVATYVPFKGSVIDIMSDLISNIKSGLSYSGARNIKEFQQKAQMIKCSHSSFIEAKPHILNR